MGVVQVNISLPKVKTTDAVTLVQEQTVPPPPIFDTPAIVTYLTLVIALAVYLRTVSASLTVTIESLLSNPNATLWPLGSKHRDDKLALLKRTRRWIQRVAPVIFIIAILASIRLLDWALASRNPRSRVVPDSHAFDMILAGALVVMVAAMFILHLRMSWQEKKIREQMETFAAQKLSDESSAA